MVNVRNIFFFFLNKKEEKYIIFVRGGYFRLRFSEM